MHIDIKNASRNDAEIFIWLNFLNKLSFLKFNRHKNLQRSSEKSKYINLCLQIYMRTIELKYLISSEHFIMRE